MAIEFYLNPNPVHPEKGAHKAQLLVTKTLNAKELLDAMVSRGTEVTRADMLANEELRDTVILDKILEGHTIQTRLFRIRLKIEGVFQGPNDRFDPKRHQVKVVITPSRLLQEHVKALYPKRKSHSRNRPAISNVGSLEGKSIEAIEAGDYYNLIGSRFYLNKEDPGQGIFLMGEKGEKWRVNEYPKIKPGHIIFKAPAMLPPGVYVLRFDGCSRRGKPQPSVYYTRELHVHL